MLSSDATAELLKFSYSPEAARQIVSRANEPVRKLAGVTFPRRARFLYLDEHFPGQPFRNALSATLKRERTALGQAILAIESRGGAVTKHQFFAACGAPLDDRKGRLRADVVLRELERAGLVMVRDTPGFGEVVELDGHAWGAPQRASCIAESAALEVLATWIRKTGMVSWNRVEIRGQANAPKFAGYGWDLVAPSYLAPLRGRLVDGKLQPGFFAAEARLGRTLSEADVVPLLSKYKAIRCQRGGAPVLPMLLHDGLEEAAFKALRAEGFLLGQLDVFFGTEGARALNELLTIMSNAAAAISKDPDAVFRIMREVIRLQGSARNLHGPLFQFISAHMYRSEGFFVEIDKQVVAPKGLAEIDIQAMNGRLYVASECKGFLPGISLTRETVDEWLREKAPRIREWYKNVRQSLAPDFKFEFVASCRFDSELRSYLDQITAQNRHYPIEFIDVDGVMARLRRSGQASVIKTITDHFLTKEPALIVQAGPVAVG